MTLTRKSKIKDVWHHPVGHDVLSHVLAKSGRSDKWIENPLVANLPLSVLDKYAWPGFTDLLLEMCATEPVKQTKPELETKSWWKESVVYQIYLPSFMDSDHDGVGDLQGVLQRLPYLTRLGVDTLWLTPLLREKADGSILDHQEVCSNLGNCKDFKALTKACHTQGLRVIISLDISATADEHPWFQRALEEKDRQDFYFFKPGRPDSPPNNWERAPGAKAWKYFPELNSWCLRSGGKWRMDLNWDNPDVRSGIISVLKFWLEQGADGFCFIAANQINKTSFEDGVPGQSLWGSTGCERYNFGPRLHRYLRELHDTALPEDALAIGEVRGFGTEMAKLFVGKERSGLDMIVDNSHLRERIGPQGENVSPNLQDLRRYYLYWMEHFGNEKWMTLLFENANTPRLLGRIGANPLYRSILAKMLGTWLLTMRGTPVIYQGEELGLSNTRFSSIKELNDLDTLREYAELCEKQGVGEQAALQKVLATACEHARAPIPWSAGPGAGFTGAIPWMRLPDGAEHLNVAQQTQDPCSVLQHYRQLIALRKQTPGLVYGSFNPVFVRNKRVLCYFRIYGNDKWYIEMNLTEKQVSRPAKIARNQHLLLSNYDSPSKNLRPYEANIYVCDSM